MGMEATGKIYTVFETKHVSDRFRKREFVLELNDNPKYPQLVLFQATGDKCDRLDDFEDGTEVRIEFSLRGREWKSPKGETKYFNTLDVWKIERVGARPGRQQRNEQPPAQQSTSTTPAPAQADLPPAMDDDIPF